MIVYTYGCKVVLGMPAHHRFMQIVKSDPRYRQNKKHIFTVTTIEGTELLKDINSQKTANGFSEDEIKLIAKTIWGEARGESYEGKIAVANVILNRYKLSQSTDQKDWWGESISEIILQPYQFSCHNYNDVNKSKIDCLTIADVQYYEILKITRNFLTKNLSDNTGGATHYFAYKSTKPIWATNMIKTKRIGNHDFYR